MDQLMCRDCGEFIPAFPGDDDMLVPSTDTCLECGGTEFKDIHTNEVYQTD